MILKKKEFSEFFIEPQKPFINQMIERTTLTERTKPIFDIFEESKNSRKITAKQREFNEQALTPKILEKTQTKSIVYARIEDIENSTRTRYPIKAHNETAFDVEMFRKILVR